MKYIFFTALLIKIFFPTLLFASENIILTNLSVVAQKEIILNNLIEQLKKKDLKNICKQLGISSKGTKSQLIIRIKKFLLIKESKDIMAEINTNTNRVKTRKESPIILETANEAEYIQLSKEKQEILIARGEVYLKYKKIKLRADKIKLNNRTKEMMCEGDVILWDGSKEITGEKIFYNLNTGYGIIYNGKTEIGNLVYKGRKIKQVKEKVTIINEGQFTSCNEDPPHYYIEAKKLWVYPHDKIVLLDAYYVIAGVKVFWIPIYFRFEKGTGIITSWGKREIEGWYMQNTYKFKAHKNAEAQIKFDHYQRRGEYAGVDYHYSSPDSEVICTVSGAYDKKIYGKSNINPDTGKMEREYRGKASLGVRYTFNRDEKNKNLNTTIRGEFFRQSDYSFIQDFEMYRSIRPGFHYYDKPIYYNNLYNLSTHNWYIHITDSRANSSLSITTKWNFNWNPILEKYVLYSANVPDINYKIHGYIFSPSSPTNKGFYPNIRYSTILRLSHTDYYTPEGEYLKSLDYRYASLSVSKSIKIRNFVQYSPSLGIGNQAYWPYNVSDSEKNNYAKMSYSFGNFSEILQFGPAKFNLRGTHNLKWRFEEYSVEDEYGKIVAHSIGISHRNNLINGINYYVNTSYNLRTKKDEKLRGIDKERFSNLNNQLTISLIKNVSISERYIYSIRKSQPLTSNLSFRYNRPELNLPFIGNKNSFSFTFFWNHNFTNPRNSRLNLNSSLNIKIDSEWSINISTLSVNEKLYLYSKSLARKYEIEVSEASAGKYEYRNFFVDLLNSINIFEPSKMRDSYFKLRRANINVNHDLHCWELAFGYTLQQRFFSYGKITQYPYFEHSFWLRINMKIETKIGMKEEYKTEPPIIEE